MDPAITSLPQFYTVNCSNPDQQGLCLEYSIEGFPTILAVKYPQYYEEYSGSRTAQHMYRFYKYLFLLPPLHTLQTPSQYQAFTTTDLNVDFVKGVLHVPYTVHSPMTTSDSTHVQQNQFYNTITERLLLLSTEYRNIAAFAVHNKTDSSNTFTFEIIRQFDTPKLNFDITDRMELETVLTSEWKKSILPLFGVITPQNYQYYLHRELPIVWVFYDINSTSEPNKQLTNNFIKLAQQYHNHLLFVKIDSARYGNHAINFGLQKGQIPGIVIENRFKRKNYIYPSDRPTTYDSINTWLGEFTTENLAAVLRSEDYTKYNLTSPVKHVIGSQYDNFRSKTHGKDVVVLFYATWCTFTPHLRSTLESLIQTKLAYDTNLIFAEVDVSLNDVPSVVITETPMIYVFPANIKDGENPLVYAGNVDIEAIFTFISKVRQSTPILPPKQPTAAVNEEFLDVPVVNNANNNNHKDEL
jgi:thiol-disulfide isomerase/thioredoxin